MAYNKQFPSSSKAQSKFSNVPTADIKRSRMDRSHGLKTTFGSTDFDGKSMLTPVFVDEVLPGDSFHMKSTGFFRLATPLHPIMDNLYMDVHYFFVPYRLVWDDWQHFMGERDYPEQDPNDYSVPQIAVNCQESGGTQSDERKLAYYFGLPMVGDTLSDTYYVSALPFRAYNLIWNEWYRDQNLQDRVNFPTGAGPDSTVYSSALRPRGKRKDYFTSALPWPQKGDPVVIPVELTGNARVYANPSNSGDPVSTTAGSDGTYKYPPFVGASSGAFGLRASGTEYDGVWEGVTNAATINDLRTAFQIQKLLERDARGGTRYTELIQSHFGVTSPDSRLQRPEYLGGGSTRVTINPVANTAGVSGTADSRSEGALGAYGTGVNQATFSKSFTEHGIIIGLASYRADLTYQRGIERFWSRQTRYDFYWPALSHLGEQAILRKEIHFRNSEGDDDVFAYQERYGEYRFKPSRVTGLFNSDASASLDPWHLAQDFDISIGLGFNESFITENPPIDRTIAVPDEPFFLADFWFDLKCDRPMPMYGVPGMVDHF